jgi:hypothetical protein
VAECFWPDVREEDLRLLEARIAGALATGVRYLGSLLIREDEVVLFQFEGALDAVRAVATNAQVPFERLLETTVATPTEQGSIDA